MCQETHVGDQPILSIFVSAQKRKEPVFYSIRNIYLNCDISDKYISIVL